MAHAEPRQSYEACSGRQNPMNRIPAHHDLNLVNEGRRCPAQTVACLQQGVEVEDGG
jgi:hypothetical protein